MQVLFVTSVPTPRFPMARPRSEAARQKMLDAVTELALTHGVRALTIDEVARRSGVAKTTIYRHFPSKNELIVTALDGITPVPEVPDTGCLHDDLVQFLGSVMPIFASRNLRALFLDVMATAIFDEELAELQHSMMQGRGQALASIVEQAKERGELPADLDLDAAFELIEGPLIVRSLGDPASLDDLDLEELVERIIARLHA